MLSWLFKKRGGVDAPKAAPALQPSAQSAAGTKAEHKADSKAKQAEDARAVWFPRLQSAQGDDAKLLLVAQAAPLLEIKLAAVDALHTEDVLKQAERELRSHDRRVHRAVKLRLEATVAQREARARAQTLIETATTLTGDALVPVNRLVVLDREWQALEARLLDPEQPARFAELRDRLNASIRERGEQEQHLQRWTADATRALAELRLGCAEVAVGGAEGDIALRCEAAQALRDARPDVPVTAALDQALRTALQTAALVEARLAWLAAPDRSGVDPEPACGSVARTADVAPAEMAESLAGEVTATVPVDPRPTAHVPSPAQRWQALPPLADRELAGALDERFERWLRAQAPARPAATVATRNQPATSAVSKVARNEQLHGLDTLLQQAEGALADGQLGDMLLRLQAVDAALETMNGILPSDTLRARHHALQAERARLKGWQQWGGGRARDGLMAEAQELARLTLAAADPEVPDPPKLHLKTHGDAIHALRLRWKELDRLGAPASQALWQQFDAALQTAHQPVAAHQAVLKAARQDNLLAREALLVTLEALPASAESVNADDMPTHWKEQLRALERFQLAWRQLGPLEHTVPAAARSALQQRLRSSVDRIEVPLQEARRSAEAVREQLIARAEALAQELGLHPQMRDASLRVRELQAEWQQHARMLTLTRAVESALWSRFKAATDAVFAQRDAVFSAREAELAANLAAREALVTRLTYLVRDTPVAEIQRTLAEVDRAWRQAIEVPRAAAGAIDARFRDARAAALQSLADSAQAHWQLQCDTLTAKLALCEERECASADDGDLARRWAAHEALPAAWEQALAQRWSSPVVQGPLSETVLDDLLLQLEVAFDLPAAPEWQAARRNLKLRAMKDALEGRGSPSLGPTRHADSLAAVLRESRSTATQRERLHALIAALRRAPAGSLAPPTARAETQGIVGR